MAAHLAILRYLLHYLSVLNGAAIVFFSSNCCIFILSCLIFNFMNGLAPCLSGSLWFVVLEELIVASSSSSSLSLSSSGLGFDSTMGHLKQLSRPAGSVQSCLFCFGGEDRRVTHLSADDRSVEWCDGVELSTTVSLGSM